MTRAHPGTSCAPPKLSISENPGRCVVPCSLASVQMESASNEDFLVRPGRVRSITALAWALKSEVLSKPERENDELGDQQARPNLPPGG